MDETNVESEQNRNTNCKLNITQEIADVVELDLTNPNREDPYITADLAGNQMYFDCFVPEGYVISQRGIWKIGEKIDRITKDLVPTTDLICSTRLMPTGKYVNADTGADVVELTFIARDKVEKLLVPFVAILGSKEWKDHIRKNNYGRLDVLDTELKETMIFLKKAIRYNEERVNPTDPQNSITKFKSGDAFERTGWSGEVFSKFVIGTSSYKQVSGRIKSEPAVFIDTKDINVDKRLKPKGTPKGWFDAVRTLLNKQHPKLRFAMYYAAGSLLLAPLKSANSAFGIIADTSEGKTFTLQVVASMFGNPSEKGDGLILNGNVSITALNAILTSLTDIPVFIDEITMMNEETKKALTYAIGNGQEALRGRQDGNLRSSRMIRTNAIITGEVDIVSEFAHNGAQVRAFACRERPIPVIEQSTIKNAKVGVLENYGHIMRILIARYFEHQKEVDDWYTLAFNRLENSTNDTLAKRKADYFATAEVGGIVLESIFKDNGITSMNYRDVINDAWEEFVLEDPDTPLEIKALEKVYRWALSHPRNFLEGDKQPLENHADDLFGWWVYPKYMTSGSNYEFLDLNKQELEKFLRQHGYDKPLYILQYWRNHDITVCNNKSDTDNKRKGVKKSKEESKKLLTYAAHHYYQFNKPMQLKGIIRIKMDKIKELVEQGEIEEDKVRVGLQSLWDDKPQDSINEDEDPYGTFGLNEGLEW